MKIPKDTPEGTSLAEIIAQQASQATSLFKLPSGKVVFISRTKGLGATIRDLSHSKLRQEDLDALNKHLLKESLEEARHVFKGPDYLTKRIHDRKGNAMASEAAKVNLRDDVVRANCVFTHAQSANELTQFTLVSLMGLIDSCIRYAQRTASQDELSRSVASLYHEKEITAEAVLTFLAQHNRWDSFFNQLPPHFLKTAYQKNHDPYGHVVEGDILKNLIKASEKTPVFRTHEDFKRKIVGEFHAHTNMSDGKLSPEEVIQFYGERAFDFLCITDHVAEDWRKTRGRVLRYREIPDYIAHLEKLQKWAWDTYHLNVIIGLEYTRDFSVSGDPSNFDPIAKKSSHLLMLGLSSADVGSKIFEQDLPLESLMDHAQKDNSKLVIVPHPHYVKGSMKSTLEAWDKRTTHGIGRKADAWEAANNEEILMPVILSKFNKTVGTDFHSRGQNFSMKTILECKNSQEAIFDCVKNHPEKVAFAYLTQGAPQRQFQHQLYSVVENARTPSEKKHL